MAVTIPIPHIGETLGGSVIYEEYKGDFAAARRIADAALATARTTGDPSQLADALLACGIVQMLQGEIAGALACLDEAAGCAPDPEVQLRARAYAEQAMQDGYNLSPGGGSEVPDEPGALMLLSAYLEQQSPLITTLAHHLHTPGVIVEGSLRGTLGHTRLLRYDGAAGGRAICLSYADQLAQLRSLRVMADADPSLLAYLDWQTAVGRFAGGDVATAQALLAQATARYREVGDKAGEAGCLMQAGDWLAAPLSSPDLWTTWLSAGSTSHSRAWAIEAVEMAPPTEPERAQAWYDQAAARFASAGAPRGTAALALRSAYLATLTDRYDHALAHAERAQALFAAAGDYRGAQLARTHRMLARIGAGHRPEDTAEASAIGAWGRETRSWSYALGLGVLCARIGRRWLIRDGDYERAVACFRLGEHLFAALKAPIAQSKCIADQCETYKAVGDLAASVVSAERGLDLGLVTTAPHSAAENWQQIAYFGWILVDLSNQRTDPSGLEQAATRLDAILKQCPQIPVPQASADPQSIEMITAQSMQFQIDTGTWYIRHALDTARFMAPTYQGQRALKAGNTQEATRWFAVARENMVDNTAFAPAFLEALLAAFARRHDDAARWYRQFLGISLITLDVVVDAEATTGTGAPTFVDQMIGGPPLAVQLRHLADEQRRAPIASAAPTEGTQDNAFITAAAHNNAALQRQKLRGYLQQALEFFTRARAYADAQAAMGWLEVLDVSDWWRNANPPWALRTCRGMFAEGLGHFDVALQAFDQAITIYEQQRGTLSSIELKATLAADSVTQELFYYAARAALKLREHALAAGDTAGATTAFERAFAAVERGKARSLLDLMAGGSMVDSTGSSASQPLRAWRRASAYLTTQRGLLAHEQSAATPNPQRIAALGASITTAEEELGRAETALAAANPQIRAAQQMDAVPLTVAEVSAALPPDGALLQYAFLADDLLAWAITAAGVAHVHRVALPYGALERAVTAFRHSCEGGLSSDAGEDLSNLLLEPFAPVLKSHRRLIIIPYGAAHSLPFQALPWQETPLGLSHTLSYLPSASTLRYLERPPRGAPRILAVGGPAAMTWTFPGAREAQALAPLKGATVEARFIAGLFPGSIALVGEQATAAAVHAAIPDYSMLHFATHGVLSAEAPLLSSILLANGEALSVYELMGMRFDADLVVLSACRTAEGETTAGDEVLGLTRGLLAAGARAAVVSLWPVDDLATSLLMGHFYQELHTGAGPAAALRVAQTYLRTLSADAILAIYSAIEAAFARDEVEETVRNLVASEVVARNASPIEASERCNDYSHPHYWAPFVVVGG